MLRLRRGDRGADAIASAFCRQLVRQTEISCHRPTRTMPAFPLLQAASGAPSPILLLPRVCSRSSRLSLCSVPDCRGVSPAAIQRAAPLCRLAAMPPLFGEEKPEPQIPERDTDAVTGTVEEELKPPPLYRVILVNDDYTPMEFVVHVLESFFRLNREQATQIMLAVHTVGRGVCGMYPRDMAETKAASVNAYARQQKHPLLCEVEAVD